MTAIYFWVFFWDTANFTMELLGNSVSNFVSDYEFYY